MIPYPKKYRQIHKGFTLIELLIVILLVGIVYALGFSDIEIGKKKPKALTPLNIKENIMQAEGFSGHATLLCVNKCRTCYLRKNIDSPFTEYKNAIDLSQIKAYTIDDGNSLVPVEYERYNDKKICLTLDFYDNGSSTQIILQDDKSTYFLPAFFDEAKKFNSPEDAKEYWLENSRLVSDDGDFY